MASSQALPVSDDSDLTVIYLLNYYLLTTTEYLRTAGGPSRESLAAPGSG